MHLWCSALEFPSAWRFALLSDETTQKRLTCSPHHTEMIVDLAQFIFLASSKKAPKGFFLGTNSVLILEILGGFYIREACRWKSPRPNWSIPSREKVHNGQQMTYFFSLVVPQCVNWQLKDSNLTETMKAKTILDIYIFATFPGGDADLQNIPPAPHSGMGCNSFQALSHWNVAHVKCL